MDRFTISLNEDLAEQFDELIRQKGYQNRSEAVRDMLRTELEFARLERHEAPDAAAAAWFAANPASVDAWLAGVTAFDGRPAREALDRNARVVREVFIAIGK